MQYYQVTLTRNERAKRASFSSGNQILQKFNLSPFTPSLRKCELMQLSSSAELKNSSEILSPDVIPKAHQRLTDE